MKNTGTLDTLLPGESGNILKVGNAVGPVRRRLIDMGLTPGTEITVKKIAPFGDPLEVTVRGYELSLRKEDAAQITIGPPSPRRSSKKYEGHYTPRRLDNETLRRMAMDHEHEDHEHPHQYNSTAHDKREMKIALAGNPNSGKTTLYNALTGSNQYVGNWPGVTVEKKEGKAYVHGRAVTIVDLPGIYSLSPYSMEEIVSRDYIIAENPDAIINIVDASNLERNMYLTIQLLELEKPMVIALNFMDEVEKRGDRIDVQALSKKLGVPIVPITARTGENLDTLLSVAHRQMHVGFTLEPDDLYDDFTHEIHHRIGELIHDNAYKAKLPAHWAAIKLLEGDEIVDSALQLQDEAEAEVRGIIAEYEAQDPLGDRETLIADSRYRYIEEVTGAALVRGGEAGAQTISTRIDSVVTNKYLAVPVFLLTMFLVFAVTFGSFGTLMSDAVGTLVTEHFGVWVGETLRASGSADWIIGLCVDGIIAGVGGVLTFLPQIALLFLFLSLLEDSGYMARAAFIMDRLLKRFGLSGKAFIPMLMGFGCTVPAVMGARTMENEKDRRMTIMLVPFMSCSAKLPVFGLFSAAFFGERAGLVVFALYVLGMLMAVASGLLFKNTLFKGSTAPFVLELPPYRLPTLKNTVQHVWDKLRGFIVRAGTLIFVLSVALWVMQNFDFRLQMTDDSSKSILGILGGTVAPLFTPLGFGTWQAAVALLTGLFAKEAIVASLSMFYGFSLTAESGVAAAAMAATFTKPLAAFSYLVFILLYVPCVAAIATTYREMNSFKWAAISAGWQIFCAYAVSLLLFQAGTMIGL